MLTSTKNPLVKQLRSLGENAKNRKELGLFLIEGTHALTEAIATAYPLSIICCTEKWISTNPDLYQQIEAFTDEIDRLEIVSEEVLQAIATTQNPDGVIAAAFLPSGEIAHIKNLGLALETIQDPGNIGAIVRSAVAVGLDGMLVSSDSVDLTNPKIIRATAGQWFRCAMQTSNSLTDDIRKLKAQGVKAIATLPNAKKTYWDYDFTQPTVILLGNEGNGLSDELIALADEAVSIPQSDRVESLNVAICAALLLYEAKRQNLNNL
ncbi:RNA methyltransferase [Pseudanabaena sp. FACHB-1998]|uniref:TrmH family RNA methyltransferase n=1 Tax=Pseudanabaena sp. FACHB-1998 TaxID=2692858 RepID=UPI00167FE82E|nr:RNA methyltransferase [Pseudanabaena sp. FACHB-1998]MBD2179202.1 RNA methyltransferase [Pseudanabaena sp. FACHB-1998]